MSKGIYSLAIKGRRYIGQDSYIGKSNRYNTHMSELRRGKHFNSEMQTDFDNYGEGEVAYEVLASSNCFNKDNLNYLERYFISVFDTFNSCKGYNKTKGGIGMLGFKYGPESLERKSERVRGEDNPQSKLNNAQFFEIVELLKEGKTNTEIADLYGLHSRYVSLIRHKRRFTSLWEAVPDYKAVKSSGNQANRKLDFEMFKEVVGMIEEGHTNASIERKFSLSGGAGSRIRHRKLYVDFWEKVDEYRANGPFNDYQKQA